MPTKFRGWARSCCFCLQARSQDIFRFSTLNIENWTWILQVIGTTGAQNKAINTKCPKMSQILTAWCKEKLWQDDICGMRDSALLKMKRRQVACTQGLLWCCGAGGYSAILNGASLCIFNARAQNNVWNSQCVNDRPCFHGANWNLLNHWRMRSAKWIPIVPRTAVAEVSKIGDL